MCPHDLWAVQRCITGFAPRQVMKQQTTPKPQGFSLGRCLTGTLSAYLHIVRMFDVMCSISILSSRQVAAWVPSMHLNIMLPVRNTSWYTLLVNLSSILIENLGIGRVH